jgi:uncharacterized membrane protein
MSWSTAFRLRQFARGSLWLLPLAGGLLGVLLGSGLVLADQSVPMPSYWTYSASTASTVLSAIVGAMVALTGFVVTVTVLVVQMATGTFSARYMRLWYRDRVLKILLALLVGTFAYSFVLLQRIENNLVPNLGVSIAGLLVLSSLLLFVFFLDRFTHRLRPVAVAMLVADYYTAASSVIPRLSRPRPTCLLAPSSQPANSPPWSSAAHGRAPFRRWTPGAWPAGRASNSAWS